MLTNCSFVVRKLSLNRGNAS
ncbi:protein of unknown function [Pararobbsia alpina]